MANKQYLHIMEEGLEVWNKWRQENPHIMPDLSELEFKNEAMGGLDFHGAILKGADFAGSSFYGTNFDKANLQGASFLSADCSGASFVEADLKGAIFIDATLGGTDILFGDMDAACLNYANLEKANLSNVSLRIGDLYKANLTGVNLTNADLTGADLREAKLIGADLRGATLNEAILVGADLTEANLTNCTIFGIAAWNVNLTRAIQSNLIITDHNEPVITVDNLEIAQFVYLLLHNAKLRNIIDTLTTKSVLILGRFTPERKAVLDAIREELRRQGYIPILFDFEKPDNRDLTETVMTLASLSRFVIVDLSDPNSSPHEVMSFARALPSVPVKPIFCPTIQHPKPYPMFADHLGRLPHVLPIYHYETVQELIASLEEKVIKPAEEKVKVVRPIPLS